MRRQAGRRRAALLAGSSFAAGGLAAGVLALPHGAGGAPPPTAGRGPAALPGAGTPPVTPAFTVPRPRRLAGGVARWAPVLRPVWARTAPAGRRLVHLGLTTPEGTTNAVLAIGRTARHGHVWVHVRLPVLPNGLTGWIERTALGGYHVVHTRLVVDRRRLRATLYRDGRRIWRAPVGIGRPGSPTPTGHFYIRDELHRFASPFYGPIAFGTSARSPTLTDWPADGYVGIHGTNQPGLVPGRVSHGCIRLRNADIVRLARLLPVGTPLVVR